MKRWNAIKRKRMLDFQILVAIPKSRSFDQEELRRVQQEVLVEGTRPFNVASPEGTILNPTSPAKTPVDFSQRDRPVTISPAPRR